MTNEQRQAVENRAMKELLGQFRPKLVAGYNRDAYIPPGYSGWCHQCKIPFKTMNDLIDHIHDNHHLKGNK